MGLSSYLPGFSDDATSDFLGDINYETSRILNNRIIEADEKLKDANNEFWNKWFIANCISTSLKHGACIDADLIDKAKEYYKYCLAHPSIKNHCQEDIQQFKDETLKILQKLDSFEPIDEIKGNGEKVKYYYQPFFEI